MLQVNNIEVAYMKVVLVLHGVSLEVGGGKIVALIGANGGGKTTTLKAISGLLKTEEGEITGGNIIFNGRKIEKYGPEDIAVVVVDGHQGDLSSKSFASRDSSFFPVSNFLSASFRKCFASGMISSRLSASGGSFICTTLNL